MGVQKDSGGTRVPDRRVAYIPGDGIGPEVARAARRCLDACVPDLDWDDVKLSRKEWSRSGHRLSPAAVERLRRSGRVLKGPLEGGFAAESVNPNALLRAGLESFATVRRCRGLPGTGAVHEGLDLLILRPDDANVTAVTEAGPEHAHWKAMVEHAGREVDGVALRFFRAARARRFLEFAFAHIRRAGRKHVTLAHRASAYPRTDGAWLKLAEEVARGFPTLEFEDQLADHVGLQLARAPHRFEAIVAPEPWGELLADVAVGLAGGLGVAPQVHYGALGTIYTSVHGTAPKYAGTDQANPVAMILAGVELLQDIGETRKSARLEAVVREVLRGGIRTPDLAAARGGGAGTGTFVDTVIERLKVATRPGTRLTRS